MESSPNPPLATTGIDGLLAEMRPELHRYCARMVGSVIDGEDVLQDALIKAVESFASAGTIGNPRGWLFRIAHNTALDFLRQRNRQQAFQLGEEVDMITDPADDVLSREIASTSLRTFMRLPLAQRASVILMDVLGCSLSEVCDVMDFSLPAVKAALHRGQRPASRTGGGAGRSATSADVAGRSRAARRLRRAFQRAGFRCDPRHDLGRCQSAICE